MRPSIPTLWSSIESNILTFATSRAIDSFHSLLRRLQWTNPFPIHIVDVAIRFTGNLDPNIHASCWSLRPLAIDANDYRDAMHIPVPVLPRHLRLLGCPALGGLLDLLGTLSALFTRFTGYPTQVKALEKGLAEIQRRPFGQMQV